MKGKKSLFFILMALMLAFIYAYIRLDLARFLDIGFLKERQNVLISVVSLHPVASLVCYVLIYILVTGFSLPGATILTLAGGSIFGLLEATILVSIASTVGASLAFLSSRYLLRDEMNRRFSSQMSTINSGIEKEGNFFLFALRLTPLLPFFVINLTMGLTSIPLRSFFIISQLGMLPGTILYVNAGVELGSITSIDSIASPGLIISFAAIGFFPLLAKKIINFLRLRRQ
ncbi:MAG: TVP38/TMEM64 family protein [Pseudomonadota bacterium]